MAGEGKHYESTLPHSMCDNEDVVFWLTASARHDRAFRLLWQDRHTMGMHEKRLREFLSRQKKTELLDPAFLQMLPEHAQAKRYVEKRKPMRSYAECWDAIDKARESIATCCRANANFFYRAIDKVGREKAEELARDHAESIQLMAERFSRAEEAAMQLEREQATFMAQRREKMSIERFATYKHVEDDDWWQWPKDMPESERIKRKADRFIDHVLLERERVKNTYGLQWHVSETLRKMTKKFKKKKKGEKERIPLLIILPVDIQSMYQVILLNNYLDRERRRTSSRDGYVRAASSIYSGFVQSFASTYSTIRQEFTEIQEELEEKAKSAGARDVEMFRQISCATREWYRKNADYLEHPEDQANWAYYPSRLRWNPAYISDPERLNPRISVRDFQMLADISTFNFGCSVFARNKKHDNELIELIILVKRRLIFNDHLREVAIGRDFGLFLDNDFIQPYKYTFQDAAYLYFVAPPAEWGTFENILDRFGALDEDECRFYFSQAIIGLEHLHTLGITHRNVHPASMKVKANGYIMLGDIWYMGMMTHDWRDHMEREVGPVPYRHGRNLESDEEIYHSIDFWSLGCLLHEMATGSSPRFYVENEHVMPEPYEMPTLVEEDIEELVETHHEEISEGEKGGMADDFSFNIASDEEDEDNDFRITLIRFAIYIGKKIFFHKKKQEEQTQTSGAWEGPFAMWLDILSPELVDLVELLLHPLIEERLGSERTHWQRLRLSHFMRGFNWEAIFCQGAPVPQRILEFHQKDAKEGVPHVTKIHEEPGRRVCYLEELKERSREKSAEFSGIFDSFFYKF